ncbi:nucleotidyltransferase domain-containing protein [Streptomonospora nanhaiensis]|uniref:Polymerase nucleotidyl transferase domain-containing protein n=1 Tax=Streptomonospora nanhaiensis TaxID=1323731 RepID=A0A853BGN4_9ACTN|nr:nucleotidyltransferase domain-containing protein [Streptomonospora nanhaiensis]MBV2366439.1 nucleotidyltransferase domain-containing protein [Streptomonospora nanhaiensis]MBX9389280.1 nucleotidyltransferase domain-containing protein [Streptomonospora nanhaiensis]NYI94190.1 hypothetical protein [Streptomonospora nanhaiensis]
MALSDDTEFRDHIAQALAGLPGVQAVALGGSRAAGTHTPHSDWDFALYYRHRFDPADLRALGWPGEVFDIGSWGGGVFNGGAWLQVEGRHVDVHYRDLHDVDYRIAEAAKGRFDIEHLAFHRAGVPTYIVVAELAGAEVLHGRLPRPDYPDELARQAPQRWWQAAQLELAYARTAHAQRGHLAPTLGALATAAAQAAHAVMAARRRWVTNEKRLLEAAGLRHIDEVCAHLDSEPPTLMAAVDAAAELLGKAVERARA